MKIHLQFVSSIEWSAPRTVSYAYLFLFFSHFLSLYQSFPSSAASGETRTHTNEMGEEVRGQCEYVCVCVCTRRQRWSRREILANRIWFTRKCWKMIYFFSSVCFFLFLWLAFDFSGSFFGYRKHFRSIIVLFFLFVWVDCFTQFVSIFGLILWKKTKQNAGRKGEHSESKKKKNSPDTKKRKKSKKNYI